MSTVHFICNGNIFRSRLAEAYLKSLQLTHLQAMSSGLHAAEYQLAPTTYYTERLLQLHDLGSWSKTTWNQLTQIRLDEADIQVFLRGSIYEETRHVFAVPGVVLNWNIPDISDLSPEMRTTESQIIASSDRIYQMIQEHVDVLVASIRLHEPNTDAV